VLEYVSFSANTVHLGFDGDTAITVFSSLEHRVARDGAEPAVQSVPLSCSHMMQLAGQSVLEADGDQEGTLTLVFENQQIVRIFDDTPNYESYLITHDGNRICTF
jgi:hypothetical protein